MIFYVNQQSNAKLKFGEAESGTAQMEREEKNRNIPAYIKEMLPDGSGKTDTKQSNELQKQVHSDMPFAGGPPNRNIKPKASGSTVFLKRPPTTRLDTAIALYMPPQVQVSYKSQYSDTPIGGGVGAAMDVYSAVMAGRGVENAMKVAVDRGGQALKEGLKLQKDIFSQTEWNLHLKVLTKEHSHIHLR